MNGSWGATFSNPLGFKHHPLEGAGFFVFALFLLCFRASKSHPFGFVQPWDFSVFRTHKFTKVGWFRDLLQKPWGGFRDSPSISRSCIHIYMYIYIVSILRRVLWKYPYAKQPLWFLCGFVLYEGLSKKIIMGDRTKMTQESTKMTWNVSLWKFMNPKNPWTLHWRGLNLYSRGLVPQNRHF